MRGVALCLWLFLRAGYGNKVSKEHEILLELRMRRSRYERINDSFVQIAQLAVAVVVGVCSIIVACASCSVADSGLRLELAEALPEINVQYRQFSYGENEILDTGEIIISNDDGYLCNPKSEVVSFARVRGHEGLDVLIPAEGAWFVHAQTGNTKGVIERIWAPQNLQKIERAFDGVEARFRDTAMFIELETYIGFSYQDLQGIDQARYYRVNQVGSATVLTREEYEASVRDDERIVSDVSWSIDSTSNDGIVELLEEAMPCEA